MNQRFAFTAPLYRFLLEEGFKYIFYKGLDDALDQTDSIVQQPYILIPSKDNLADRLEDTETIVESIDSLAVREMLEYTPGIDFYLEIPMETAERFSKQQIA